MGLANCSDCGKEISTSAKSCPYCGRDTSGDSYYSLEELSKSFKCCVCNTTVSYGDYIAVDVDNKIHKHCETKWKEIKKEKRKDRAKRTRPWHIIFGISFAVVFCGINYLMYHPNIAYFGILRMVSLTAIIAILISWLVVIANID